MNRRAHQSLESEETTRADVDPTGHLSREALGGLRDAVERGTGLAGWHAAESLLAHEFGLDLPDLGP